MRCLHHLRPSPYLSNHLRQDVPLKNLPFPSLSIPSKKYLKAFFSSSAHSSNTPPLEPFVTKNEQTQTTSSPSKLSSSTDISSHPPLLNPSSSSPAYSKEKNANRLHETLQNIKMLNKSSNRNASSSISSESHYQNDPFTPPLSKQHIPPFQNSSYSSQGQTFSAQAKADSHLPSQLPIGQRDAKKQPIPPSTPPPQIQNDKVISREQSSHFTKHNHHFTPPSSLAMPLSKNTPMSGIHRVKVYDFSQSEWTKMQVDGKEKKTASFSPFINEIGLKQISSLQSQYLMKVNELVDQSQFTDKTLYQIIQLTQGDIAFALLHQYASQSWNMDFFLSILRSSADKYEMKSIGTQPSVEMASKITHTFGSFSKFKEQFEMIATAFFGSGWIWLIETNTHDLQILTTMQGASPLKFPKAAFAALESKFIESPSTLSTTLRMQSKPTHWPLLGLNLWEHAYLWTHPNKESFVQSFWRALDWKKVENHCVSLPRAEITLETI